MKLTLFFTDGVSLQTWNEVGIIDRELALYKALQHRGVKVSFVTYGDGRDLQFAAKLPGVDLRVNNPPLPRWFYKRRLQYAPPQGDVFKSNQVAGAEVGLVAARRAGAQFVARCGYLLSQVQRQHFGEMSDEVEFAHRLEGKVFQQSDAVVVTTIALSKMVREQYSIHAEKIRVIPNYVETDRFRLLERTNNERLHIVFVGRLAWEKNVPALIEAVSNMDVEVWLIGYGPLRAELEHMAQNKKAEFRFWGSIANTELPRLLNKCDIFVLPSLYEGHPKALLEAMACGLPVVGTRVPGTADLIQDGVTGLLCEPEPSGIRAAVSRLAGDKDLRRKLGKAGRSFVEQHFALDHVVDLEMTLLNELTAH